jgi:hypothetical protein
MMRADRRGVLEEVEVELLVIRRVDRVGGVGEQQRVAVGGRADHRLGRDVGGGAGAVLDHELLAEPVRPATWPIRRAVMSTPPPAE